MADAVQCETRNDFDGKIGLRVSAIFVILIGSMAGAIFPILANRYKHLGVPKRAFFFAKYFGSGVIIATAFIHLLSPANDALRNPCLTGVITQYDWVNGICLLTIFALFFVELMVMRFAKFESMSAELDAEKNHSNDGHKHGRLSEIEPRSAHVLGTDHHGHSRQHTDIEDVTDENRDTVMENYSTQLTAIFILEFGIIFHSIFIGLTLAVSGREFSTLYIVLVFHQTFEGLGLGSRLAVTPFPRSKRWTPYVLGFIYGISTPIAIAVGLGIRNTYPPGSATTLIVNGCFDSISAGILIYTGLVELMAHEFMFSNSMRRAHISKVLYAYGIMTLGAGLMALLGKWA